MGGTGIVHRILGGAWLTRERVIGYAAILLGFELLAAAYFAALAHGLIVPLAAPYGTDFASFYTAGELANAGTPWLAYDRVAHAAAQARLYGANVTYNYFYYPPIFLMLCALLAKLPFVLSATLFLGVGLAAVVYLAWTILGERDWKALVPLIAFPPLFWNVSLEQNAFLTAALFAAATWNSDRRPILAGILFGALIYKPHFGVLIPIALAASCNWRAFLAAGLSALSLGLLSLALFGRETWDAYIQAALHSGNVYATGIDVLGLATPYGAVLALGGPTQLAIAVQAAAALIATAFVAAVWSARLSLPVRSAALLAALPLTVPILLYYDLVLDGVAMVWLLRAAREDGSLPYEKFALAAIYLAMLFTGYTNATPRLLFAPLAAAALFAIVALRARQEWLARRNPVALAQPA